MNYFAIYELMENVLNLKDEVDWKFDDETGKINVYVDVDLTVLKHSEKFSAKDLLTYEIQFGTVVGDFTCSSLDINKLTFAPDKVYGSFYCDGNRIYSLEGCPVFVGGDFNCRHNGIRSLIGGPMEVIGDYLAGFNDLESLVGMAEIVMGEIDFSFNNLKDLDYLPLVKQGLDVAQNRLETIKGLAERYHSGDLDLSDNLLNDLEGCPKEVKGSFSCKYNPFTCLKHCPEYIYGSFEYGHTQKLIYKTHFPKLVFENISCPSIPFKLAKAFKRRIHDWDRFVEKFNAEEVIIFNEEDWPDYSVCRERMNELFFDFNDELFEKMAKYYSLGLV